MDLQPTQDREVAQIREDAMGLLYKAEEIAEIKELAHEERAVEFLSQIKLRSKKIDEKRKSYTDPLNLAIKTIKGDFDTISKPLEEAEAIVKQGIRAFREAEDFRIKEAARKEAELAAKVAINRVGAGDMSNAAIAKAQEANQVVTAANAEAPRTVSTMSGTMRTRKDWKHEVTTEMLVPREYCSPDPRLIREAIKAGKREIPGVRIWEEVVPIILGGR